jgi:hypothetical protein
VNNEETRYHDISTLVLECLLNEELSIEERVRRAREIAAVVMKEIEGDKYENR